jgi:hypothetical protein
VFVDFDAFWTWDICAEIRIAQDGAAIECQGQCLGEAELDHQISGS